MPLVPVDLFVRAIVELVEVDDGWLPKVPEASLYLRPYLIATEAFLGVCPVGATCSE